MTCGGFSTLGTSLGGRFSGSGPRPLIRTDALGRRMGRHRRAGHNDQQLGSMQSRALVWH